MRCNQIIRERVYQYSLVLHPQLQRAHDWAPAACYPIHEMVTASATQVWGSQPPPSATRGSTKFIYYTNSTSKKPHRTSDESPLNNRQNT